jgi:hypothetical protein
MSFLTMARRRKVGEKGIAEGEKAAVTRQKKKRPTKVNRKLLIAAALLLVAAIALALLLFLGPRRRAEKGKGGHQSGKGISCISDARGGAEPVGLGPRIDRSWERLYAEALSDPSSHEYFRLLAASLSRIAQSALASAFSSHHADTLAEHVEEERTPRGKELEVGSWEPEVEAGEMLLSVASTLGTAVLRSLWEKLNSMHVIRDRDKLNGHIVMPEAIRLQQVASGLGVNRSSARRKPTVHVQNPWTNPDVIRFGHPSDCACNATIPPQK